MLMDDADIRITDKQVITPVGEFPLDDIRAVTTHIKRPLLGPVLLALLGTINLAAGMERGFWLDFAAAGLMFGCGLLWRQRGTRYRLLLRTSAGEVNAWSAPDEARLKQATELIDTHRG
jgi:hypothetical protein